jgi:hypothetical protein
LTHLPNKQGVYLVYYYSSFEKILRLNFDPRLEGAASGNVRFFTEALSGMLNTKQRA